MHGDSRRFEPMKALTLSPQNLPCKRRMDRTASAMRGAARTVDKFGAGGGRGRWLPGLLIALALTGCAAAPTTLHIEGWLEGPPAGTLAAQAEWVVELRDDSADQVLAEQRGTVAAAQPPIPFALSVDAARIASTHHHSVRGALSVQGETRWLSAARPIELAPTTSISVGSLRLQPYVFPGSFASALDCAGRRLTLGYVGEQLRLSEGDRKLDLQAVRGSQPPRFELAGDPTTFVQLDDGGATVSLQGRSLAHCTAQALR